MTDRYWLFGKILGHMEAARSIEKFAYGVYRSENRVLAPARGPFICLKAHMGRRSDRLISGNRTNVRSQKIYKKFSRNDLIFLKFGPLHPWWARSIIPHLVALVKCFFIKKTGGVTTSSSQGHPACSGLQPLPQQGRKTRHHRNSCRKPHRRWFPAPHGNTWSSSIYSSQSSSSQGAFP